MLISSVFLSQYFKAIAMKLKISANISWLFKESDNLLVRYKSARDAGFEAVESRDLSDIPLEDVVAAKAGACVTQVLMNAWPGKHSHDSMLSYICSKQAHLLCFVVIPCSVASEKCPLEHDRKF